MVTSALLGRGKEANATLKQILAVQPGFRLAWIRQFLKGPLQKNLKALEVYLAAARSAGVPDG
jgi:hypothetical protein